MKLGLTDVSWLALLLLVPFAHSGVCIAIRPIWPSLNTTSLKAASSMSAGGPQQPEQDKSKSRHDDSKSPQAQLNEPEISISVRAKLIILEPMPGVRMQVLTYEEDLKKAAKFPDTSLLLEYQRLKSNIARLDKERRALPLDDQTRRLALGSQLEGMKSSLVAVFQVLRQRGLATSDQAAEVFSISLTYPGIGTWVKASPSKLDQQLANERIKTNSLAGIVASVSSDATQVVRDEATGLALGYLEANPAEQVREVEPAQKYVMTRTFVRAFDDALLDSKVIYAINMEIHPDSLESAVIRFVEPKRQIIGRGGKLINAKWTLEIETSKDFKEQELAYTASLIKFNSQDDLDAQIPAGPIDSIAVPLSTITFRRKPSAPLLPSLYALVKDLFGLIGVIATAVLATRPLVRASRRWRSRNRDIKARALSAEPADRPAPVASEHRADPKERDSEQNSRSTTSESDRPNP